MVIDYKTGRLPSGNDIVEGRALQLPLYHLAAEQLLGTPCMGGAFHAVAVEPASKERLFATVDRVRGKLTPRENFPDAMAEVAATVGRFVENMRAGRFDALPTHDCSSYCEYRHICRYSEIRAARKSPAGQDEADHAE